MTRRIGDVPRFGTSEIHEFAPVGQAVESGVVNSAPILSLAPMQDVSILPLWRCLERRGGPDLYITEYFRVHRYSRPRRDILESVLKMGRLKPVRAQMIGNLPEDLARTAGLIQEEADRAGVNLEGIDLNLGCPAPRVCGKSAGGALLRDPDLVRTIAARLREAVSCRLTLKTRVGFESEDEFDALLELFADLPIDELAIHGRTVRERYRSPIHPDCIARAVQCLPFPVVANGNIVSVDTARALHRATGASGLMVGRGAIRNPWLFSQIREGFSGRPMPAPTRADLHDYLLELIDEMERGENIPEGTRLVHRMKKFTNYIASGLDGGEFQDRLRRARSLDEFLGICRDHLDCNTVLPHEPEEDGTLFCGFRQLVEEAAAVETVL